MKQTKTIVVKTLSILREIKKVYGADKADLVWQEMSKTIADDDLTLEIFTILLNGGQGASDFRLVKWHPDSTQSANGKVPAIRKLREWTRIGLKEAKDAVEAAETTQGSNFQIARRVDEDGEWLGIEYDRFEREMRAVGLDIEYI